MSEIFTFFLKTLIIVLALPVTFLLTYLAGLLISKLATKYCPECAKRKKDKKVEEKLFEGDL